MSLASVVRERSLIVCVGPGGVGKTTMSAALALAGAIAGRRTLVLTIDPARRLADALGLPSLEDEIRSVPLPGQALGRAVGGTLDAAMVDTARSYAALVERVAPDESVKHRILDNRVFQAVSRSMARSHAYIAMERLYDAMVNREYDLVVLDTPPARNALDILDAPHQLARFLDARFVEWFLPAASRKGLKNRILAAGGEVAKKFLGMITGQKLLDEIVDFLDAFATLREGFVQRAQRVDDILRAPSCGFVLVSSASPASADDAAWLQHDLQRRRVPIEAVIFNQSYVPVYPERPEVCCSRLPSLQAEPTWSRLSPHLEEPKPGPEWLEQLRALRESAAAENARSDAIVSGVEAELEPGCRSIRTPRFQDDIRELDGLLRLVAFLLDDPGSPL